MRSVLRTFVVLGILSSVVLILNVAPVSAKSSHDNDSRFKHIFYIMMENHATDQIFGNTVDAPYINELASRYASSTDYFGVTHPSLPNYLAAISGNFQHIWDDCKAGPTVTCAPEEFGPTSGYTNGQELLTPAQITQATNTPHWFNDATIVDQLEHHQLRGFWRERSFRSHRPVPHRGEHALDRIRGAQMSPMLGREVEERE